MAFEADLLLSGAEIFHPIFKTFIRADLYIKDGKFFHIDFAPETNENTENLKNLDKVEKVHKVEKIEGAEKIEDVKDKNVELLVSCKQVEKSSAEYAKIPSIDSLKHDKPLAKKIDDWSNKQIVPGFIDIHMHIESSMLTPTSFSNAVLRRGVTTVVAEPHEIANVCGIEGIKHFIEASKLAEMDIFIALPSSVPSTRVDLETTGGVLNENEMMELYKMPEVISVGEVMNYRDIIKNSCDLPIARFLRNLEKYDPRATIEGHCPQLTNFELSRFLWKRIQADHTEHNLDEIKDRVRRGMFLEIQMKMLRKEILSYLCDNNLYDHFSFITDDTMPDSLVYEGQLDAVIRQAIKLGVPREMVFYCTSETAARRMKLVDRGRLLPGYLADCVVIEKNETLDILAVYKNGKRVEQNSAELSAQNKLQDREQVNPGRAFYHWPKEYKNSIKINKVEEKVFAIRKKDILKNLSVFDEDTKKKVATSLSPELEDLIAESRKINNPFERGNDTVCYVNSEKNNYLLPLRIMDIKDGSTRISERHLNCSYNPQKDEIDLEETALQVGEKVAMLVSINRYSGKGEKSCALVTGDMIKKGAIASTWSHDAHNLMVMGFNSRDMQIAANRLIEIGGGIIAVEDGRILAELNLEIAGIVTEKSAETCADKLQKLREAWQSLGYNHYNPFMSFGTLGLLVSPSLKLSDKGLVTVEHASRIPLLNTQKIKVESVLHKKFTDYFLQENEVLDVSPLLDYHMHKNISLANNKEACLQVKVADFVPRSPGRVPMYKIDILLNKDKVGHILLRTEHWSKVLYGGNIGYGINPNYRGLGLLEEALPLIKDLSIHHGLKTWVITNDEWNYASRKVCEKLGSIYLGCFELPKDNDMRIEGKIEKINSFYYPLV